MSCLSVIFIGSWILPLRFLKLLRSPCVDKIKRYERRRDAKDARPSSAQNVGDALAEVVREGALLEGRQAVGDHMPHPCQMPKLAAHGHRSLEVTAAATTSSIMPKHEFSVDMTCEGCSNAVTRVLNKLGGVQFDIDLPNKKVCINSEHSVDTLLETLGKTGKAVSYLGPK